MRLRSKLKLCFLALILSMPLWHAEIVLAGEEQRAPPEARTAGTLSEAVMRSITRIQEMMSPEDEDEEPDLAGAKEELDDLRERRWERMNDFEKSTLLNFYTNYYLTIEDYPNAILTFEEILAIGELRQDVRLRTLRSLGQLYASEENWRQSINYYDQWRQLSEFEDDIVYRGLAYAHYMIEEFTEALPYWIAYMEFQLDAGVALERDDYAFLSGLYFTLEDYESAEELLKTMIVLFDNPVDWQNLTAVYATLDEEEARLGTLTMAYLKGYLDDEQWFMNLGQSLGGNEVPYTGAKIIAAGLEGDFVEEDADNMTVLTQMYLIASLYEDALEPARRTAELDPTGDGYDTLGYLHYVMNNYEESVEAFRAALDKGDLSNEADTQLFLARALVELDEWDEARAAARASAEAGDRDDQEAANNYLRFINDSARVYQVLSDRRQAAIDFYESYPPLR